MKKERKNVKTIINRITRYLQNNKKTAVFWRYRVSYFILNFLYSLFFLIDSKMMDFVIYHKATRKELVEKLQKNMKENLLQHYFLSMRKKFLFFNLDKKAGIGNERV